MLARLMKPLPVGWSEQLRSLGAQPIGSALTARQASAASLAGTLPCPTLIPKMLKKGVTPPADRVWPDSNLNPKIPEGQIAPLESPTPCRTVLLRDPLDAA